MYNYFIIYGRIICMELHDKLGYRKAIIVDERMLIDLDKCIRNYFTSSPNYSADLLDESIVVFESLDELIQYDNFGNKAIKYLKVSFGYNNSLVFKKTLSSFHSYEYSLLIEYVIKNMDDNILFKKEMIKIFEKGKRPWYYTFVTKFSYMYFFIAFMFMTVIFGGILYFKDMFKIINTTLTVGMFITWFICTALILFMSYLLSRIRNFLFPVISYNIGEQKKQIEGRDKLISNIFWSVIVAGILAIIVGIFT